MGDANDFKICDNRQTHSSCFAYLPSLTHVVTFACCSIFLKLVYGQNTVACVSTSNKVSYLVVSCWGNFPGISYSNFRAILHHSQKKNCHHAASIYSHMAIHAI